AGVGGVGVVEVARVGFLSLGALPAPLQVLDTGTGRFTGVVPALERRDQHRAGQGRFGGGLLGSWIGISHLTSVRPRHNAGDRTLSVCLPRCWTRSLLASSSPMVRWGLRCRHTT